MKSASVYSHTTGYMREKPHILENANVCRMSIIASPSSSLLANLSNMSLTRFYISAVSSSIAATSACACGVPFPEGSVPCGAERRHFPAAAGSKPSNRGPSPRPLAKGRRPGACHADL
ncbi:hypothetical protein PENSPDRAFT_215576 [Peniophora sp. CONT]|nr:hypothetical protein PENSPDRAFT_215576 [Peniophora sp. CONT]